MTMKCACCDSEIDARRFELARQIEVTEAVSEDRIETEVADCVAFRAVCLDCGPRAALAVLESMGLTAIKVEPDPPAPLCARCHGAFIDEKQPHVVYSVDDAHIDESQGIADVDQVFRAVLCLACGAHDGQEWAERPFEQ